MRLYVEQDALDVAAKVPFETSPQEMVDYLIDNGYAVVEEPKSRTCTICGEGGQRMSDLTPEQAARKRGKIALVLDQEAAEFYIELFHDYNAGRTPGDVAVSDDENYLRKECELMFGEDSG